MAFIILIKAIEQIESEMCKALYTCLRKLKLKTQARVCQFVQNVCHVSAGWHHYKMIHFSAL